MFAVFPSVGGRLLDELTPTHLQVLGRHRGCIHRIGATIRTTKRKRLDYKQFGKEPLAKLKKAKFFETAALESQYFNIAERIIEEAELRLQHAQYILVHGDCHLGNTLWRGEQCFFLDFDDLCLAPAFQYICMIIRGRDSKSEELREILIKAYN